MKTLFMDANEDDAGESASPAVLYHIHTVSVSLQTK